MPRISRKQKKVLSKPTQQKAGCATQIGIYARLSVEDTRKKENDSIGSQKQLVMQYVDKLEDAEVYDVYEDVNFSGTNFKRPGFERLIEDAKSKKINCIVVKDLSRFGRNYLEAGQYLECVFPFLGIRFISINDGYDSAQENATDNLIVPLKNLMNEMYARDISKKVKTQYSMKRERGEFCGTFGPYGYTKVERHLEIDEQAAEVVKSIYAEFLSGIGDLQIAERLNQRGVLPPSRYRYEKGIVKGKQYGAATDWHKSAVKRVLTNPVYTGSMHGGANMRSMMNKEVRSEVIVCENTHEAIISLADFQQALKLREVKRKAYKKTLGGTRSRLQTPNIFKGYVYCADCGVLMQRHKQVKKGDKLEYRYLCRTHENIDKSRCSRKYVSEDTLRNIVWNAMHTQIDLFMEANTNAAHIARWNKNPNSREEHVQLKSNSIHDLQKRLQEILVLETGSYSEYAEGRISKQKYLDWKERYAMERKSIQEQVDKMLEQQAKEKSTEPQDGQLEANMFKFRDQKTMTAKMLVAFIEKIEVKNEKNITITFKYRDEMQKVLEQGQTRLFSEEAS